MVNLNNSNPKLIIRILSTHAKMTKTTATTEASSWSILRSSFQIEIDYASDTATIITKQIYIYIY